MITKDNIEYEKEYLKNCAEFHANQMKKFDKRTRDYKRHLMSYNFYNGGLSAIESLIWRSKIKVKKDVK